MVTVQPISQRRPDSELRNGDLADLIALLKRERTAVQPIDMIKKNPSDIGSPPAVVCNH
jgi:hypothetical protein